MGLRAWPPKSMKLERTLPKVREPVGGSSTNVQTTGPQCLANDTPATVLTELAECPFPVSPSAEESLPSHCGHGPRTAGAGECGQWSSDHRLSLPQPQRLAVKPQPLPAPPPPRGLTLGLGIPLVQETASLHTHGPHFIPLQPLNQPLQPREDTEVRFSSRLFLCPLQGPSSAAPGPNHMVVSTTLIGLARKEG